jgi:Uma2 family endonuclease
MPTLVLDPQPSEIGELLERRRAAGADRWDEVWDGVLVMVPPPSAQHQTLVARLVRLLGPLADEAGLETTVGVGIGVKDNHLVPDLAFLRAGYAPQWNETAALVVEVVSPNDKTWEKLGFYAARHVDELLIVDPAECKVACLSLKDDGSYQPVERSGLIELAPDELAQRIDWP